jgi:membrane-associated phospholipid phosphatase
MRLALVLLAAFAVLTAAVATGALRPVDRYAIHHAMPYADDSVAGTIAPSEPWNAIRPIVSGHRSFAQSIGALVFAPADTISALLLAAGATVLVRRRGRPWRAGGIWIAAVVVGLVVEVTGKLVIPQIHYTYSSVVFGVRIDGTFPSGHTTRSVIVAAMLVTLWPRLRPLAIAWVVYVTAVLELGGLHVPSDIAGGFLIGGALAAAAVAYSSDAIRAESPLAALQSARRALAQAPRPADVQGPRRPAEGGGRRPGADRGPEQPETG